MAKSKRKRTVNNSVESLPAAKLQKVVNIADSDIAATSSLFSVISQDELDITLDTLRALNEHPMLIKSKAAKDLRVAVFNFRQACTTGVNTAADSNLTSRISAALTDGKNIDARVLLSEMRLRGQIPKLGALCRWVRDLDVVSGLATPIQPVTVTRSQKEKEQLILLDAILRLTGPIDSSSLPSSISLPGSIHVQPVWNTHIGADREQVYASVLDKSVFTDAVRRAKEEFRILERTPAAERKPPNKYPATLHTSNADAILLSTPPATTRIEHPTVPNLSLIHNVLTAEECKLIVGTAECIGFEPDSPLREDDGQEASVLAHNFYWITDESFSNRLWERVKPYVPEILSDGRRVRGVNRRWRVYRYVPGAEYRMHIDGAWPPSGINTSTGAYMWDSSPPNARQSSLFTFLIYLNDEFEGGETTFFLPNTVEGVLSAFPVKPVMGAVAVFPHGDWGRATTSNPVVLHEGTGVKKGAKYVVRTDVEYDVEPGASN